MDTVRRSGIQYSKSTQKKVGFGTGNAVTESGFQYTKRNEK